MYTSPARKLRTAISAVSALGILVMVIGPARADSSTVSIQGNPSGPYYYAQNYIVIHAGDSVSWVNDSNQEHTVTSFPSDPKPFDSSPQTAGACNNHPIIGTGPATDCIDAQGQGNDSWNSPDGLFTKPGKYYYYCKVHGSASVKPNPKLAPNNQPCGMCGVVVVAKTSTPPPPPPRRTHTPTPTPSASPSVSPSVSPSASQTTTDGSPIAAASGGGGGGGGGRAVLAVVLILVLSAGGYGTWRKFLAPRS